MRILDSIQHVDVRLFNHLFRGKLRLKKWAYRVSRSADGHLYVLLPLLYGLGFPVHGRTFFILAFSAFLVERLIYFVLKRQLKRRRPPAVIPGFTSLVIPSDEFSFPSGHTSAAFLFSTLCYFWFGAIALPLYLWATMVGISRVMLGVHFVTDTMAGAVIGTAIAFLLTGYLA